MARNLYEVLFLEVNGSVDVRQVAFLSAAEQVADEFGDRELSIMAELVKQEFVLIRNGGVNILVARKFLLSANSSHVLSLVGINSRSAAIVAQCNSPLFEKCKSEDKK